VVNRDMFGIGSSCHVDDDARGIINRRLDGGIGAAGHIAGCRCRRYRSQHPQE
jgi:hypothetical protein